MHPKEEGQAVVLRGTPTSFLCGLHLFPLVGLDISPRFQSSSALGSLQTHMQMRALGVQSEWLQSQVSP